MPGTLFVVATPIGNLEDMTLRARHTLEAVDVIAAEDTRRTAKLLAHFQIRRPVLSVREHNEAREAPRLIQRMLDGQSVALVTDAGTPGIADPGAVLVRAARQHGIGVVPIPGPSAVTAALSASGFDASEFVFLGFAPSHGSERRRWFEALAAERRVAVFFEAPHRLGSCVEALSTYAAGRAVALFGELTKLHERSVVVADAAGLFELAIRPIGEFVLVLDQAQTSEPGTELQDAVSLVGRLTSGERLDTATAVSVAAKAYRLRESFLSNQLRRKSILAKRQNGASS